MYLSSSTPFYVRYWALSGYCSILREEQVAASEDDKTFLQSLSKDTNRPSVERSIAGDHDLIVEYLISEFYCSFLFI